MGIVRSILVGSVLALSLHFPINAKTLSVTLTAYCACTKCCGKQAKGLTASGTRVVPGIVAVDPKVIPLGSLVKIGSRTYKALDIGGAIRGKRIDIYMVKHEDARQFGVKKNILVNIK